MKKTVRTRMACLLLALATVLVSAPMLVLPLAAAETAAGTTEKSGFNTKYEDAGCGYTVQDPADPNTGLQSSTLYQYLVIYNENWSAGRITSGNILSAYIHYNSGGFLVDGLNNRRRHLPKRLPCGAERYHIRHPLHRAA